MTNTLISQFHCYVHVSGTASHPDDQDLPGTYAVRVVTKHALDLLALTAEQETAICKSVLDEFHDHQGIEVLDDFNIIAVLENGHILSEHDVPITDGQDVVHAAVYEDEVTVPEDFPAPLQYLADAAAVGLSVLDIEFYVQMAQAQTNVQNEVRDLREFVRNLWTLLTPAQRVDFAASEKVHEVLDRAAVVGLLSTSGRDS